MKVSVVLGLGFGDEGKGLTTNWLCKDNDLVIRFNGGHQAGHTVVIGENRHVFSNFGSGTLKGAPTYWSKYCTIDPLGIMEEYKALKSIGANPVLYIDPYCPVVTPFDIASNRIKEKTKTHGSCGIGFGETVRRHESYFKLHALDLLFPSIFNAKLDNIKNHYYDIYDTLLMRKYVIDDALIQYKEICNEMLSLETVKIQKPNFKQYHHIIFEGAQGILLDMDYGFFPNVTRSNCTSKNAIEIIKDMHWWVEEGIHIYYITRSYQTRHGNGFMTNENFQLNLKNNEKETNKKHPWQGNFRTGALDLELINYAIQCDMNFSKEFKHNLVMTCLDQLDEIYVSEKGSTPFKTDLTYITKQLPGKIKNFHFCHSDKGEFI